MTTYPQRALKCYLAVLPYSSGQSTFPVSKTATVFHTLSPTPYSQLTFQDDFTAYVTEVWILKNGRVFSSFHHHWPIIAPFPPVAWSDCPCRGQTCDRVALEPLSSSLPV